MTSLYRRNGDYYNLMFIQQIIPTAFILRPSSVIKIYNYADGTHNGGKQTFVVELRALPRGVKTMVRA